MARARPLILIPPSEGKAPGGTGPAWAPGSMSFPELDVRRARVAKAVATAMSRRDVGDLLGVKGVALAAARDTNRAVLDAPTMPAIERYTGVLYDELRWSTLPAAHRRHGERQIVIFSAVWGLVSPTDAIPDYKLKMGARLGRLGILSTWWRPALTDALGSPPMTWNLLPNEHASAYRGTGDQVVVRFLDDVERAGRRQLITVSHWNKQLKGALVRHLLATGLDDPVGLAAFEHPLGYRYRPDLDVESNGTVTVSMVARR